MNDLDLLKLEKLIYLAAKKSFSKTIELHKDEEFYCFALFTSNELNYIAPTSFTENGLNKIIQKYQLLPSFSKYSEDQLSKQLRWNPCDSPIHLEFEEEFDKANEILQFLGEEIEILFNQNRKDEAEKLLSKIKAFFFNVIEKLDKESFFDPANKREKLVLNLLMGDQSDEEILSSSKILNSEIVYDNFKQNYAD